MRGNPPQLYIKLSTFFTDSLSRTLSDVTGHIPPFAKVAAITDLGNSVLQFFLSGFTYMLSVVISREQSWK